MSRTDRGWWLPVAAFAGWIVAIGIAADACGARCAIAAWILPPLIVVGWLTACELADRRYRGRHRSTLEDYPTGALLHELRRRGFTDELLAAAERHPSGDGQRGPVDRGKDGG